MDSCNICFCEFEKGEIVLNCLNNCQSYICGECMSSLINYSEQQKIIPSCVNCKEIYQYSMIKQLSLDDIQKYESACFELIFKNDGDSIKKELVEINIVNKIRDDRLKFIEKAFYPSIVLVAKIAFQQKLRRIDKQKSDLIKAKIASANKSCFNSTCNGFLDKNYECMTCFTIFCTKCEQIKKEKHICSNQDIQSIQLVNESKHCPGCKLPVFKDQGCDSITCSNCGTNFTYSSGKVGGYGSLNAKIHIDINKKYKLSNMFKDISAENMSLLLGIEAVEPVVFSRSRFNTPIKYYLNTNDKQAAAKRLAVLIEDYSIYKRDMKKYTKLIVKLEDDIKKSSKDDVKLKIILDDCVKNLNI